LVELLGNIPKEFVHSITPDHGTEFLHLDEIRERLGITIYWPDPYSPEQRGTNENTNGLIREYFPKRTDIDDYTEQGGGEFPKKKKGFGFFPTPFLYKVLKL